MGLVARGRLTRLHTLGLIGLGGALGVLAVVALALPAQGMGTINGNQFSDTWTASVPIYYLAVALSSSAQQANEVGLSCGSGSTTDSTGGPSGNLLECHFPTPAASGTFAVSGTNAWGNSVTFSFYVSTDGQTYTSAGPFTIAAAPPTPPPTPAPVVTPTPTTPGDSATPTPRSESKRPQVRGNGSGSPWFWLPLGIGIALMVAALSTRDRAEDEEESEELDGDNLLLVPCAAERAAVAEALAAANRAAMVASDAEADEIDAQRELDTANGELSDLQRSYADAMTVRPPSEEDEATRNMVLREDEDARKWLLGKIEEAVARARKARLELEIAQSRFSEAQAQAGAAARRLLQARSQLAACLGELDPATDGPAGVYPDYASGGGGPPLPPQPVSPIPGVAYGGDVHEATPADGDDDAQDPEGTGTESDGEEAGEGEDPPPRTPIG